MFVFHNDIVKLAACRDLECRAFSVILWLEREERRDQVLDFLHVESGRWRAVEVKRLKLRTHRIRLLVAKQLLVNNLRLEERVNTHQFIAYPIALCSAQRLLTRPLLFPAPHPVASAFFGRLSTSACIFLILHLPWPASRSAAFPHFLDSPTTRRLLLSWT